MGFSCLLVPIEVDLFGRIREFVLKTTCRLRLTDVGRTLYSTTGKWSLPDDVDPLRGWHLDDIDSTSSGTASADIYGKLYYHVHHMLSNFLDRLRTTTASFDFSNVNALQLPLHIPPRHFDRIEVS